MLAMTAPTETRRQREMRERLGERPEFLETLKVAVPLWVAKWRDRPADAQVARARSLGQHVATHGDRILYRTKGGPTRRLPAQEPSGGWATVGRTHAPPDDLLPNPSTAECFNALAEGVALLALLADGGVEVFGLHWEAT